MKLVMKLLKMWFDILRFFYNRQRIKKAWDLSHLLKYSIYAKTFTVRLPDKIYQVFFSVVDSRGH